MAASRPWPAGNAKPREGAVRIRHVTEHAAPGSSAPGVAVPRRGAAEEADVIVVGAGPAGSAAAYYLASSGLDVLLLEKSRFPREKVCGDGLTPRGVRALIAMGVPTPESGGWLRNKGLRVIGAGMRLELPWPELASFPGYGLVRTRRDLDETLARRAQSAGARLLEGVSVTGPVIDERTGRISGVTARPSGQASGGASGPSTDRGAAGGGAPGRSEAAPGTERAYRSRLVI